MFFRNSTTNRLLVFLVFMVGEIVHASAQGGQSADATIRSSISEDHGIEALADEDLRIYSVGISTGGIAEMRMAKANSRRQIIATTIDREGALFAEQKIQASKLQDQIEVRIEDVASALPYPDASFDFVYARLVLHYLPKAELDGALCELHRILKPGGRIFVVVRSDRCPDALGPNIQVDPETRVTTYVSSGVSLRRYFHSEESMEQHLRSAGFAIQHIKSYEEHLCSDFQRLQPSQHIDVLIEVLAVR
jgi:ubiquinone/menaquinone biosynthesis C-methylase UbiE